MLMGMMSGMFCISETVTDNSKNVGILSINYMFAEIPDNIHNFSTENTALTDKPMSRHHASCSVRRANI
jgi:hypothetical protein